MSGNRGGAALHVAALLRIETDDAEEAGSVARDLLERACQAYITECVRIRAVEAALRAPHRSYVARSEPKDGPAEWVSDECRCGVGADHWTTPRDGTFRLGPHLAFSGPAGMWRMQEVCSCPIGHDHEAPTPKENPDAD